MLYSYDILSNSCLQVLEFISKLKKAYKKLLSEEKWLAPETKAEAILKVN